MPMQWHATLERRGLGDLPRQSPVQGGAGQRRRLLRGRRRRPLRRGARKTETETDKAWHAATRHSCDASSLVESFHFLHNAVLLTTTSY